MTARPQLGPVLLALAMAATAGRAAPAGGRAAGAVGRGPALAALVTASGGTARVRLHPATGLARRVWLEPGRPALRGADPPARAADFLARFGGAFGIQDHGSELVAVGSRADPLGFTHLRYRQTYRGLPVFGAEILLHFDRRGRLRLAHGTFVPGLVVDPAPRREPREAAAIAVAAVRALSDVPAVADLRTGEPVLMIFREGLLRRVPGPDRLVFEVEVKDGQAVREFVYVDAHTGRVVDRITGILTAVHRRVHQPAFDNAVIWDEGDPLPYFSGDAVNDAQVNGLIDYSLDVYDLFANLSGGTFLSWDGADGVLHTVWDIPLTVVACPNAFWDGRSTNFCDGVAGDDTVAHEWGHAYTDSTHGLIYQWQSGALNESYSDIWGETVDLLNGAGTDLPGGVRSGGTCSLRGGSPALTVEVHSPAGIAGSFRGGGATFNPPGPITVNGTVEYVNDGVGNLRDGCQPLVGFPVGRIALVDRGNCTFATKTINAQNAGASGVIQVNLLADVAFLLTGTAGGTITVPTTVIGNADGDRLKDALALGVSATLSLPPVDGDSYRWIQGEDDLAFAGPIRDMWDPTCMADPGKVSDREFYICSTSDSGGVHTNSGVPNHAFALLVDGGTFQAQTIAPLGLSRVVSLYWRAMTVYQGIDSDFADHADALEQSCVDLIGLELPDPATGQPSGQSLSAADCQEVEEAMLAVEMRDPPAFCSFQPLLDPAAPPADCGAVSFEDDLESDPAGAWSRTNSGVFAEYLPRDWEWTAGVPAGGSGRAFYALDSRFLGDCVPGSNDQSGVMDLDTPKFVVRSEGPLLTFDHYVATETDWDGGNVSVSVNGGPFQPLQAADYRFNPYNRTLQSGAAGNTNPLAGQAAFSGSDGGENQGSWGQSQVDLSPYAATGDTLRLRFRFGVDGCNGLDGWYVDDVRVCGDCAGSGGADGDGDGFRVCDADCDDGDSATHAGAPESNDGVDNQCPGDEGFGIADEISGVAGFPDPADGDRFAWPPQPGAVLYQVARATSADMSAGCTTSSTTDSFLIDPAIPATGGALFYLVRPVAPGVGSWGVDSAGSERSVGCAVP